MTRATALLCVMGYAAHDTHNSRHSCAEAEEADGARDGSVAGHTTAARDAGEHARVGELQPGDDDGDEEGLGGTQGHPWQPVRLLPSHTFQHASYMLVIYMPPDLARLCKVITY